MPQVLRYSTDIVVIDLEACSPESPVNDIRNSNIIEIGAVRLDRRSLAIKGTFSELIQPRDFPIEPFITGFTGITPAMVANCDPFDIVFKRFAEWYGPRNKAGLAAFGVYYDLPLLRKECQVFDVNFRKYFVGTAVDIRTLAVAWLAQNGHPTSGVTVQGTLERMRLGDLQLSFHRALDDALATAAIMQFFHLGRVDPTFPKTS